MPESDPISDLDPAGALSGAESLVMIQNNKTVQISFEQATSNTSQVNSEILIDGVDFDQGVDDTITLNRTPSSDSNLTIWFDGARQPRSTWTRIGNVVTFDATIPGDIDEIQTDDFIGTAIAEVFVDPTDYTKGVSDSITLTNEPASDSNLTIWFNGAYQPRSTWSRVGKVITFTATIPGDITEIEVDIYLGVTAAEVFLDTVDYTKGVSTTLTLKNLPGIDAHIDIRFGGAYKPRSTWRRVGKVITFNVIIPGDIDEIEVDVILSNIISEATAILLLSQVSAGGSIDTHSDVDVSTVAPIAGQVLEFDGANFVPGDNDPATTVEEIFTDGVGFDKGVDDTITLNLEPTSDANLKIWFNGGYQPRTTWSRVAKVVTFNATIPGDITEIQTDILVGSGGTPVVTSNTGIVVITQITQAAFDLLAPPDPNTLFLIVG